jgi:hypothetical protein
LLNETLLTYEYDYEKREEALMNEKKIYTLGAILFSSSSQLNDLNKTTSQTKSIFSQKLLKFRITDMTMEDVSAEVLGAYLSIFKTAICMVSDHVSQFLINYTYKYVVDQKMVEVEPKPTLQFPMNFNFEMSFKESIGSADDIISFESNEIENLITSMTKIYHSVENVKKFILPRVNRGKILIELESKRLKVPFIYKSSNKSFYRELGARGNLIPYQEIEEHIEVFDLQEQCKKISNDLEIIAKKYNVNHIDAQFDKNMYLKQEREYYTDKLNFNKNKKDGDGKVILMAFRDRINHDIKEGAIKSFVVLTTKLLEKKYDYFKISSDIRDVAAMLYEIFIWISLSSFTLKTDSNKITVLDELAPDMTLYPTAQKYFYIEHKLEI